MSMEINWSIKMADRLRQLRESRKISYEKLSKTLSERYGIKISSDSLMNYEVAESTHTKAYKNLGMRVEYLRCFADFYGVSTDYLLGLAENPVLDQSTRAVCEYTGLSPATAELLHAYASSGFTTQLIDAILQADGIPTDMPEAINDSAQALAVSLASRLSDLPGIQREVKNRIATISRNGTNEYYISAEHAADLYLAKAIEIATTNIAAVVRKMRNDLAVTVFDPQNDDGVSVEIEIIKVDESDIPEK